MSASRRLKSPRSFLAAAMAGAALSLLFAAPGARAASSESRFSGLAGAAQASVGSAESGKGSAKESPGGFGFSVEHMLSDSTLIFVEHLRSFGSGSTSVGLSGVGARYYPWVNPRSYQPARGESIPVSTFSSEASMYYVGGSVGLAQASMPASATTPTIIAVAFYVEGKLGMDMPLSENWALRSELNFAQTLLGSGTVQYVGVMAGFVYGL